MPKYRSLKACRGVFLTTNYATLEEAQADLLLDIEWNTARPLVLYEDDSPIYSNLEDDLPRLSRMLFDWGRKTGLID